MQAEEIIKNEERIPSLMERIKERLSSDRKSRKFIELEPKEKSFEIKKKIKKPKYKKK